MLRIALLLLGASLPTLGCASSRSASAFGTAPRSVIRELSACAPLRWPVDAPVSSLFGRRDGRPHQGIDLAVGIGAAVRAACDGVVSYAGDRLRGYGKLLIVEHDAGLTTIYAHNQALLVHAGQRVARGQVIARSGSTGRVTAPHLHFEVRWGAVARDPLPYLAPRPPAVHARRPPARRSRPVP